MKKRSRLRRLLDEIKRRRVIRAAIVYAVVAWLVIQVANALFPALLVPAWVFRALVAFAILGFPIVLALEWVFEFTSEGVKPTPTGAAIAKKRAPAEPAAPRRVPRAAWFALGFVVALTAAGIVVMRRGGGEHRGLDANVVAVLPFRVSGADAQLGYLREGMVDLFAAKLGGTEGTRAVDSRTMLAAVRRAARSEAVDLPAQASVELARSLGAGRVLLGEVIGNPSHLVLNAALLGVPAGRTAAQASVEGPADSLTALVDRLAIRLLALESGSEEGRLASLTSTSLPALRAFLEGQSLSRRGRYTEAIRHFEQALAHDSAFALAALGLANAAGWIDLATEARGLAHAWRLRDRLGPRDRALLLARAGPRYPLPPTGVEHIEAARGLLRIAPDHPEAWFWLGDRLFHYGRYAGEPAPEEQALEAFQQSIRLDTTLADPIGHAIGLLAARGDTAAVRRLGRLYFAVDSVGETAQYLGWRIAAALGEERAIRAFWAGVDTASSFVPVMWVAGAIQNEGARPEDMPRVLAALERHPVAHSFPPGRIAILLNLGRPREAQRVIELWAAGTGDRDLPRRIAVLAALFADGDAAAGARAAEELARALRRAEPADSAERQRHLAAVCAAERWRVWNGELGTVERSIPALRAVAFAPDDPVVAERLDVCALELEAAAAVPRKSPDAARLVARLDSVYRTGPTPARANVGNLAVARLLEAIGDREGALAALRRRSRRGLPPHLALSTFLREEGRLAALLGDREGAIRAYQHYLALRASPEPALRPEVERVRTELAKLTGETRR